ncbi:SDR family NAD(P)-dependent oxidoreductase [Parashewanella curva]|uniref:SDR family NAD(P)-dependent oxidoreductase n=1 Tax=Parashewanella curva TaxID=2338552 RepID=A0A3L8Q3E9_9GAMM|nr:SDR family NAD(P)-dependent oxidoreductase [Parashewanella curva]RLV61613.1 SDR family NAD(P)-dependent oxidoreductase [Parashewanella curva]
MQKVLITGASSGIGAALYSQYISQGFNVIACGRNQQKLEELTQAHVKGTGLVFDVTQQQQVVEATRDIDELDILILNAGDCKYIDDAKHFDASLFKHNIETNLISVGYLLESLLPKLKHGGQLVLVSSSATIVPFPRAEGYGASKAGMDYLAKSLTIDLKPHNIDVSLVHPGFVKTPLTDKNDFSMPFLIDAEQAAQAIFAGVSKRKRYIHFPKRLTLLLKMFSLLPFAWWSKMISRTTR